MTYCPPDHYVRQHEFTALTGAELLSVGDVNLSCGDSFTMPTGASTCFTVTDNDASLSGDARYNETGDDRSWQIADIEVDGVLTHEGAKIYAEEYYVLHGSDGRCYYMVEIELQGSIEGDADDFYAFIGDIPSAGVELTVAGKANVCGNWLDYRDLSAGLKWDLDADGKITIEAEDMALRGYKVDDVAAASGGEVIRLKRSEGEASITFGAESGTYDLELAYIGEMWVKVRDRWGGARWGSCAATTRTPAASRIGTRRNFCRPEIRAVPEISSGKICNATRRLFRISTP